MLKCGHGFPDSVGLEADLPPVRDSSAVLAPAFVGRKILSLCSHVFSTADLSVCGSFPSSPPNSRFITYIVPTSFRISSIFYSEIISASPTVKKCIGTLKIPDGHSLVLAVLLGCLYTHI